MIPSAGQQSRHWIQLCVMSARPRCHSALARAAAICAAISASSSAVSTFRCAFASASVTGSMAGGVMSWRDIVLAPSKSKLSWPAKAGHPVKPGHDNLFCVALAHPELHQLDRLEILHAAADALRRVE